MIIGLHCPLGHHTPPSAECNMIDLILGMYSVHVRYTFGNNWIPLTHCHLLKPTNKLLSIRSISGRNFWSWSILTNCVQSLNLAHLGSISVTQLPVNILNPPPPKKNILAMLINAICTQFLYRAYTICTLHQTVLTLLSSSLLVPLGLFSNNVKTISV